MNSEQNTNTAENGGSALNVVLDAYGNKKLTREVMEAFGFKHSWPRGNPSEPWWENKQRNMTFTKMPTADEFISEFVDPARREGENSVRKAMRNVLGI